ncbi:MAG: PIN domain-containing protein [Proteobacteria bacterium]|nr:PIN domain-containing protein [Pseudomonadota bacterium]
MSGSARYTAILDACVLYPAPVRDILLSLAQAGLYHARWTEQIHEEWIRNILVNRPDLHRDKLTRTSSLMNGSVPDCLVENYKGLIAALELPDANDRHVLAAAIAGHADAIVTFNLKDFPNAALAPYQIEAQHPDDFIANQIELRDWEALAAIKASRARLKNPPKSAADYIGTLEKNRLPQTASLLRGALELI